jgi:tRNA-binding EMAP/Myf-like protein
MGLESQGMLLAADLNNEPFLLKIDERNGKNVPPGSIIK